MVGRSRLVFSTITSAVCLVALGRRAKRRWTSCEVRMRRTHRFVLSACRSQWSVKRFIHSIERHVHFTHAVPQILRRVSLPIVCRYDIYIYIYILIHWALCFSSGKKYVRRSNTRPPMCLKYTYDPSIYLHSQY